MKPSIFLRTVLSILFPSHDRCGAKVWIETEAGVQLKIIEETLSNSASVIVEETLK